MPVALRASRSKRCDRNLDRGLPAVKPERHERIRGCSFCNNNICFTREVSDQHGVRGVDTTLAGVQVVIGGGLTDPTGGIGLRFNPDDVVSGLCKKPTAIAGRETTDFENAIHRMRYLISELVDQSP